MILVCGIIDEPVIREYLAYLCQQKAPFVFLDERELGKSISLDYAVSDGNCSGHIDFGKWHIDLEQISGIYNRLGMQDRVNDKFYQAADYKSLEILLNIFPRNVCNRPLAVESNAAKPSQFKAIVESGLKVPDSYVGCSGKNLKSFATLNEQVIVKSTSSIRSIVKILDRDDLENVMNNEFIMPHQYQERLEGNNIRVHVIGRHVLACEIISHALDYRYSGKFNQKLTIQPITLPEEILEACILLNEKLQLSFSGIDLFHTFNKDWYCFEVNTCPGYTWFENHSGLPISHSLTNFLLSA